MASPNAEPVGTYVLIDAENIDWAVADLIGHKPEAMDRLQFDRLAQFCQRTFPGPVRCLVVLNVRGEQVPDGMLGFIKALRASGCEVVPVYGRSDQKVVDLAILRLLEAIRSRPAAVALASHDGGDFASAIRPLLETPGRTVAVLGFRESVSERFRELRPMGLKLYDLEVDAKAFLRRLPRVSPIPIDEFDPAAFL